MREVWFAAESISGIICGSILCINGCGTVENALCI